MAAADLVRVLDAQAQLLTPHTPSLPSPKVPWTPSQRRMALSILQRRRAPPATLQAELLSLVCHGDKCGLPFGRTSPSPPTTLSGNASLPLKGTDGHQPHVRLQLTDVHQPLRAERAEAGPAVKGVGGHLLQIFSTPALSPTPWSLLKEPCC